MLCGQKVPFQASNADWDRLYACNRESARIRNECLRLAKERFLQHGCWMTKSKRTVCRLVLKAIHLRCI
jgi:putative transposase